MKTHVDARLRAEAERYALRFACEDCVYFVADHAGCAHGYPPEPRRQHLHLPEITFCKEFELE